MRSSLSLAAAGLALFALALFALAALAVGGSPSARAQSTTTIEVGDDGLLAVWFCDPSFQNGVCETTVTAGDTVVWEWGPGGSGTSFPHTTTNCATDFLPCSAPREWDSADLFQTSGTFSHTFGPEDAGKSFIYLCQIHPLEMRGRITVLAAPTPTPTPQPSPAPGPSPTPAAATETPAAPTPAAVPNGGGAPPSAGDGFTWLAAFGLGGLALAVAAGAVLRGVRR